jgi:thioredoxin-related protein
MKQIFIAVLLFIGIEMYSQTQLQKTAIYDPGADASVELKQAITKASLEGKHVLIQVGGNWCPWCIKLHKFMHENYQIDSVIAADYVFILINYSKENKNPDIMKQFEYPQRFGFPVLLVIDQTGRRIHTQDTGILEDGEGYSVEKIKNLLLNWNASALDPEKYISK